MIWKICHFIFKFFLLLEGFNIFLSIFWSNLSMDVSHSVLVICLELIFSWTELIFVKKTSFHLISAKASSGLRKMFSQYYYNQNGVWENVCLAILDTHFPYYVMADVKPYVWWIIMLSLNCGFWFLIPHFLAEFLIILAYFSPHIYIYWQMLLPYVWLML